MFVSATVNINLNGLKRFKQTVKSQLEHSTFGPITNALILWGVRYRSFAQERFDTFSKGGGDWQPLAVSTVQRRRKGTVSNVKALRQLLIVRPVKSSQASQGAQPSILRDTGLLYAALSPVFAGAPGALQEFVKFGIRVGYGGPQRHALTGKGTATIADIAAFHQTGNPKLPQRKIIVDPPRNVLDLMAQDMEKALKEIAQS